jgi:membrane-bound metal-dependent hydrolase YbcI (DUF457 family)
MTQVGHILIGATIGMLCLPERTSRRRRAAHLAGFILLANIPDLPLKYWGHDRYQISHSLLVNLFLVALTGGFLGLTLKGRAWFRRPGLLLAGELAWLSHLLLDTLYNHGRGIQLFWPLSSFRLALPVPWFSVIHLPLLQFDNFRIFLVELICYLPIFLLAGWFRNAKLGWRLVDFLLRPSGNLIPPAKPGREAPVTVQARSRNH